MWILDANGTTLYDVGQCREIYIVDFTDIEACYGKTLKNKHCKVLGKYSSPIEAQWAFGKLVDWLSEPKEGQVFRMPYEMPRGD